MFSLLVALALSAHHFKSSSEQLISIGIRMKISKALVKSIIKQESAGNAKITSDEGAQGLMQIMPPTYKEWAPKVGLAPDSDPFNEYNNMKVGTAYIQWLLGQFDNDLKFALAAYNWGIGHVQKLQHDHPGADFEELRPLMPMETQKYVTRVMMNYALA